MELRRFGLIFGIALLCVLGGSSASALDQTLSVFYTNNCTGMRVSPSPPPAGSYNVLVYDDDNCKAGFSISGPGVSMASNDLDSSGMGIDHPAGPFGPFTFQAGSTYTARDSVQNISTTFTAAAGGSTSTGGSGSSGGGTSGSGSSGSGSSGSGSSSGSSSSTSTKTLGTIAGSVSAAGKASLTMGGSPVKKLKAGLYKLTVSDHSAKAGLVIQALGYSAMTESSPKATGTSTHNLRLIKGKYFFRATGGPKIYFTVS